MNEALVNQGLFSFLHLIRSLFKKILNNGVIGPSPKNIPLSYPDSGTAIEKAFIVTLGSYQTGFWKPK